jgi:hypothetical protein
MKVGRHDRRRQRGRIGRDEEYQVHHFCQMCALVALGVKSAAVAQLEGGLRARGGAT